MSSYDLKHKINARQEELRSTVIEAVRTLGNTTGENIPQLTKLRDALRNKIFIDLINDSPILNIYSNTEYASDFSDMFTGENAELLLKAVRTVLPEITMIQYSQFGGKREELSLFSATPEELKQLAELKEQEKREEEEEKRQEKIREIEVALQRSRIPQNRLEEYNFKDFNVVNIDKAHSNKEAYRLARQFTSINFGSEHSDEEIEELQADRHNFLTYLGTPGSGKTRLALTIGIYLIKFGDETFVRYWQVQDLFEVLKGTFNKSQQRHNSYDGNNDEGDDSYNKIIKSLKECSTLILDDLGAENGTEWTRSILDMIIDHRYENEMDTIITSNVSDISELSPRIASRLSEGNVCKILMPDFSKIKAVQREKKNRKVVSNG